MKINGTIRPAFYDDESPIIEILNQGIEAQRNAYINPFDWIEGSRWFKDLQANSERLVVCETDQMVVGWGSLSPYRGGRLALQSVKEITFYVHEDYHRMGVASSIIDHLEAECEGMGVKHLAAILLSDNQPSRRLLEKHGYFVYGLFENVANFESHTTGHLFMGKDLNIHR